MERLSAYASGGIDIEPVLAWAKAQPDAPIELWLGLDASFDLRAESSEVVLEMIRAHALGAEARQVLYFRAPASSLHVDRPVRTDEQDGCGAIARFEREAALLDEAASFGNLFHADAVLREDVRSDASASLRFALVRLTEPRRIEAPNVGWCRAVVEREWLRLEPREPGERAWEPVVYELIASIRRGETPSLAEPPVPAPLRGAASASVHGHPPQSPEPAPAQVLHALAVPSYLQAPTQGLPAAFSAPAPSCHAGPVAASAPRSLPSSSVSTVSLFEHEAPPAVTDPFAQAGPAIPSSTSTEPIDLQKLRGILLANPTPFAGATSPERLAELRAEAAGLDETVLPTSPPIDGDDVDETMMLPTPGLRAQIAALPFEAPFPELHVDRYAAMAAELQVKGATTEVLARYGVVNAAALVALKAEQDRRLTADPALRARFEDRLAHFLSFMRHGGSR